MGLSAPFPSASSSHVARPEENGALTSRAQIRLRNTGSCPCEQVARDTVGHAAGKHQVLSHGLARREVLGIELRTLIVELAVAPTPLLRGAREVRALCVKGVRP